MYMLSRPEIAIHKKTFIMSEDNNYVKRTQRDYTMSLKLQIVQEIERGQVTATEATKKYGIQCRKTVVEWLRKFGNFDWENQSLLNMPKTPEQKIMELEAQVKLLEKQKALLEQQVNFTDKKAIIFDMLIDIAEKEYNIDIRKNSLPEQLNDLKKNKNKP